ncbi:MAG: N-acetyltransferase [Nanoarchaeota archaeon]|nr:N-acetyltransferase [Nanoarchaeota archaeon]
MYISETAIVEKDVVLGEGTRVWNYSHVMEGSRIGVSCNIGDGVFIGRKVLIGDNVKIANNVNIPEGVIIKNNVFIGSNVSLKNVKYPKAFRKAREYVPTVIEDDVTIDVNACLMPGLVIGKGATIGAGAIVVRNVSEHGFVVSPPAECMCEKETCKECHKRKLQKIAKRLKYEQKRVNNK